MRDRFARLFTPGGRLGWTFVDRRRLIGRFTEPEPDPERIRRQSARRAADAQKSYQWCRTWVARPSLMLAVLVGCVKAVHPATPLAGTVVAVIVVGGPGLAWTGWRWRQQRQAQAADPDELYEQARWDWEERATAHEEAGLASVSQLPAWESALPSARRTDVYGGTLAGWQSLLTVHGAVGRGSRRGPVGVGRTDAVAGVLVEQRRDFRGVVGRG